MSPVKFFVEIALSWVAVFALQIPARKKNSTPINVIVFIIKMILIPAIALQLIAIESSISYQHGDILCAIYAALLGDTAAGLIVWVVRRLRKSSGHKNGLKPVVLLGFICVAILTAYGYINTQTIVMKSHKWQAAGLTQDHTFAFVADIHAGTAQSVDALHELCAQINDSGPEFVVFGGDMTDELTTYEDMISTYKVLAEIKAPKYFIYGNHDRQPNAHWLGGRTYSDEQLTEAIHGADITILQDKYVKLSDDLMLLGREDYSTGESRKAWTDLNDKDTSGCALVVVDHQPYDNDQLKVEESALQLSGHTHAGQIWPLQIIYRILGYQAYGEFDYPGTMLYVSAGESDWMTPLRTEAHCEWDLITLYKQVN